jgi:hypothetical protein
MGAILKKEGNGLTIKLSAHARRNGTERHAKTNSEN